MTGAFLWADPLAGIRCWFVQPYLTLTTAGFAALLLVPLGIAWAMLDHRLVDGERVAIKPTKFALSIGVYLLTASWMLGYVRAERLASVSVRAATMGLLLGAAGELCCIALQAARGRRSHLNTSTRLDTAISGTMGAMAIVFVGMLLPLAWEIARRPRPDTAPLMISAIVSGLALTFVLSALTGARMSRPAPGNVASRELTRPILRWRITGGEMRIAHFLGVHAMQAIPLMGFGALFLDERVATALFAVGVLGYCAAALALLHRASVRGRSPRGEFLPTTARSES